MNGFEGFQASHKKQVSWIVIIVVVVIGAFFMNPFTVVPAGHKGVVLDFGAVSSTVMSEGLNFRIPVKQQVVMLDVRVQKDAADAAAVSKDLQDIHTNVAVNFHPVPEKINDLYKTIGVRYKERIIDPAVQEAVKATTANYTAPELISQREKVRTEIRTVLRTRLLPYHIVIDDLSIVNFNFSKQFAQAIEAKQEAEQMAQKAQNDLKRVEVEAKQKIARAEAEAKALMLQKQVVTPELVALRKIELGFDAVKKWDGKLPGVTGGAMPFLDIEKLNK